jgi:hypothetical protein
MRNCLLILTLLAAACSKEPEPTASAAAPSEPSPPSVNPHEAPAAAAPAAAAPTAPPAAGGLTWDSQAPLVRQTPRSSMRAAQYTVEGEPRAELTVFYFGQGQGGGVDENITRWLGQLSQADGSDTAKKAKRSERKAGAITVSLVEAEGTYAGGMGMPGAPPPEPIADAEMLGAIAEGPQGAVFFKLVGPKEAVERARPAFDAMIGSLRPAAN